MLLHMIYRCIVGLTLFLLQLNVLFLSIKKTPGLGEAIYLVITKKSYKGTVLFVITNDLQPILGREACEILGFIKQIAGVSNQLNSDLFDSIWDVLARINILVVYLEFRASVGLN